MTAAPDAPSEERATLRWAERRTETMHNLAVVGSGVFLLVAAGRFFMVVAPELRNAVVETVVFRRRGGVAGAIAAEGRDRLRNQHWRRFPPKP